MTNLYVCLRTCLQDLEGDLRQDMSCEYFHELARIYDRVVAKKLSKAEGQLQASAFIDSLTDPDIWGFLQHVEGKLQNAATVLKHFQVVEGTEYLQLKNAVDRASAVIDFVRYF